MSGFSITSTTPTQAWSILTRHARDEISPLRLQELCTDNDRVSSLVTVVNISESASKRRLTRAQKERELSTSTKSTDQVYVKNNRSRLLIADFSRQRMTLETLNHLLRLSNTIDVKGFIQTIAWGQNDRHRPIHANANSANRPHFSFDQQDEFQANSMMQHPIPTSPSRSVASNMKKTRFANNDDFDDQTITSTIYHPSNTMNQSKLPMNTVPSMHMALRAPKHCDLHMYNAHGTNVLQAIHAEHDRIALFTNSIRNGNLRGINGHTLQNILVIGRGTAVAAVQFVYDALKFDTEGIAALKYNLSDRKLGMNMNLKQNSHQKRSIRFLSRVDPVAIHGALGDWNPDQTLVISIIPNGDEADLLHLTNVAKQWIVQGTKSSKREENVVGRHVLFVTQSEIFFRVQTITKPESSFLVHDCAKSEAFSSLTVAGLLPLAVAFGWNLVEDILDGAHDLDSHFVETNPRHNLPVLLALVDLWNDHFLPTANPLKAQGGRIVSPFMESFSSYPNFVAMIEGQICSRIPAGKTRNAYNKISPSGTVIDGGLCGKYDRISFQGGRTKSSELIIAMDSQVQGSGDDLMQSLFRSSDGLSLQDHLMCSFFAHADVMATGNMNTRIRDGQTVVSGYTAPTYLGPSNSFDANGTFPLASDQEGSANGNHPSTLLLCSRCDAFACGQLIALAEHRAVISARLFDIDNPFAFTSSHGSILRLKQEDTMREKLESMFQRIDLVGNIGEDDDDDDDVGEGAKANLAVKTLLSHYASTSHQTK